MSYFKSQIPDEVWKTFKIFALLSFFFHIMAALNSEGFHKLDEYGSILVPTGHKLGFVDEKWMNPVEYPAKIRSFAQIYLYYPIGVTLKYFGLENPFTIATGFRLFSSLLGFLSSLAIGLALLKFVRKPFAISVSLFLNFFFWCLPFFHARTTSENLAASLVGITVAIILMRMPESAFRLSSPKDLSHLEKWSLPPLLSLLSGIFFGFAFLFRFPMCFMIAPFYLWMIFSGARLSSTILSIMGIFGSIGLGVLIDHWGYGVWTFTPWNYFNLNILKGYASSFGTDPFYWYFKKIIVKGIPPISLLIFGALIWTWIKKPLHLITMLTLPFFLVHCFIGHKELRFLFPLLPFVPISTGLFLDQLKFSKLSEFGRGLRFLIKLSLIVNLGALLVSSLKPAYTPIGFYKKLYQYDIRILHTLSPIPRDLPFFWRYPELKENKITSIDGLDRAREDYWVYGHGYENWKRLSQSNCQPIYQSYPQWMINKMPEKYAKRSKIWSLYFCQKP